MAQTIYKLHEALENFTELLARAHQGEEIIILSNDAAYARLSPAGDQIKRQFGPLRHLGLPEDLFDSHDDHSPKRDFPVPVNLGEVPLTTEEVQAAIQLGRE